MEYAKEIFALIFLCLLMLIIGYSLKDCSNNEKTENSLEKEKLYNCYYIRQSSSLCSGGGQTKENVTYKECEELKILGDEYTIECNASYEYGLNEIE